ncbi:MAG: response regulator transcription factor [Lewinellaceae bacterium]|nr:response regulator transcription factor [Lewinellaceae bacterium]
MARTALRHLARQVPELELVQECNSAAEAFQYLQNNPADLLLLDVEMPEMSGLELLKSLSRLPEVILITSKADYAVEAFSLKVLDYIVKPVTLARLLQAVSRMDEKSRVPQAEPPRDYLFARVDNTLVRIDFDDILFVEAMGDYVRIATPGKKYMILMSMKALQEKLPDGQFFRCHRSYIVAQDKIDSIADNMIVIQNEVIPLSEKVKKELLSRINLI